MSFLNLNRKKNNPPPISEADTQAEKGFIKPVKPNVIVGLSAYTPKISQQQDELLNNRFSESKNKCCEVCGVSISHEFRKKLYVNNAWFNSCGMCYYAANLDEIPHYKKGTIVYFPSLTQGQLNGLLRTIWALDYMCMLEPENEELMTYQDAISELNGLINTQVELTKGFINCTETEVYGSMLYLLKPSEYAQRHKFFSGFRWLPERSVFEDEIPLWVKNDYRFLHPDKMSTNIKWFVSKYTPRLSFKD